MIPDDMPCKKDCPDRRAGCAVDCERRKAYAAKRDKEYDARLLKKRAGVLSDGKRRIIRNLMIKEMRRKWR